MPSCKTSDCVRVRPWLAHTPQPDEPPPDQPGEPDAPPIGDPPPQPGEVPHSGMQPDPSRACRSGPSHHADPRAARVLPACGTIRSGPATLASATTSSRRSAK